MASRAVRRVSLQPDARDVGGALRPRGPLLGTPGLQTRAKLIDGRANLCVDGFACGGQIEWRACHCCCDRTAECEAFYVAFGELVPIDADP